MKAIEDGVHLLHVIGKIHDDESPSFVRSILVHGGRRRQRIDIHNAVRLSSVRARLGRFVTGSNNSRRVDPFLIFRQRNPSSWFECLTTTFFSAFQTCFISPHRV